ncbi:hypothetical protein D3C75_898170 [compost metagenome]
MVFLQLFHGFQSAHDRHVEVHQDHIRLKLIYQRKGLFPILGLTYNLKLLSCLQDQLKALADDKVIVYDQNFPNAHIDSPLMSGVSTVIVVPCGLLTIFISPPTSLTRSCNPNSP